MVTDLLSEKVEPPHSLLIAKGQYMLTEPEKTITLLSMYLQNTKASTANTSLDNNRTTSPFMTQLSDNTS